MKTNGKKAIIATMAIAMAAGIAGSISGTVAWFQYNTRVTSEFTGTTAKCTEFLQVRTIKKGVEVTAKVADKNALPTSAVPVGAVYITAEGKIFRNTAAVAGAPAWDVADGTAIADGAIYNDGTNIYTWNAGTSTFASTTFAASAGEWKTSLTNADILTAAGRTNDNLAPITVPGVAKNAPLGVRYGNPVAGYETYDKWEFADKADYMEFDLQFRVLDIDGKTATANHEAMLAQALYLTDISVGQITVSGKENISSALRVHISDGTTDALLAPGDNSATEVTTVTHGNLDLGGDFGYDTVRDVPSNYSWSTNATNLLDYGSDEVQQVAYNMNKKMGNAASNDLYPVNDGKGKLSGGTPFGNTVANAFEHEIADADYLTLHFAIWLEGWQELGVAPGASAATYNYFVKSAPTADVGADNDTAVCLADNKLYTKTSGVWNAGATTIPDGNYTVAGGLYTVAANKWSVAARTIWDAKSYIGARFNIGMSFGVTTLNYTPYNA